MESGCAKAIARLKKYPEPDPENIPGALVRNPEIMLACTLDLQKLCSQALFLANHLRETQGWKDGVFKW
jgi:hypothetical protein